jgi:DNA-binding IclR family transcriptional regulator
VERHGGGPTSLSALRVLLAETRQRGFATEDGEITAGLASVAAPVLDHNGLPLAGLAVTYPASADVDLDAIARAVQAAAAELTTRVRGR